MARPPLSPNAPRGSVRRTNLVIVLLSLLVGGAFAVGVMVRQARLTSATARGQDVWCEGLPVERCGEYPEECHVAVYCDGESACTSWRNHPRDLQCGKEGYAGGSVACCPGLVGRCGQVDGRDKTCDDQRDTDKRPLCLACGDGVCGSLEQRCNCPEDCQPTAQRPKVDYRGRNPEGPRRDPNVPPGVTRPSGCLEVLDDGDAVRNCLGAWAYAVLGRSSVEELRVARSLEPLTAFDLDLLECLNLEHGTPPDSRPTRQSCLQALSLRNPDARLAPLLRR